MSLPNGKDYNGRIGYTNGKTCIDTKRVSINTLVSFVGM